MGKLFAAFADFIRETDKFFFALCVACSCYGCLAVYSATHHDGSARAVIVQAGLMLAGIVAAVLISLVDFERYTKYWYLIAALGLIPVILTFFIGFAPGDTDDKAWLDLGFATFQPAELLKICFIVTFSAHLSVVREKINRFKVLIPVCLHGAFPVVLIHFQGDDGTALVFAIIVICMLMAAGLSWKYFLSAFLVAVAGSPILYFLVMNDDQRARIVNMLDVEADIKNAGYQQYHARLAFRNGGWFGQGFLNGDKTSVGSVPEGHNDFILASIGEELGFIGAILVVVLLAAVCLRVLHTARVCRKYSGKYICVGFFAMIFAQTVINVGMCLSILPVIGITLPFFSAGGTSLFCLYLGVGLVLSVYKHRNFRTIYLHD